MSKKIIIFDDDTDILEVTSTILRKKQFNVKTIDHLAENFIDEILHFQPDVILMDVRIPEIGGKAATREIKEIPELVSIPVVLFTAHNNGKESLLEETGADEVLFKPFNIQALIEKIDYVAP